MATAVFPSRAGWRVSSFAGGQRAWASPTVCSVSRQPVRAARTSLRVSAELGREYAAEMAPAPVRSRVLPGARKRGIVHIKSTKNNTIIALTNMNGATVYLASAGSVGFKNARKGTPYAAEVAAKAVVREAVSLGVTTVLVFVRGIGNGRESAIRGLAGDAETSGLEITLIRDKTRLPFNG